MPHLNVDDMKARVKIKMLEMGVPGFMTGFFTRNIPKLNRWRKG